MAAQAMQRAREAKRLLGPSLGSPILDPLSEGEIFGVSYAVLPYCRPIADPWWRSHLEWRLISPRVLAWLRSTARATMIIPEPAEIERAFAAPLAALAGVRALPARIRGHALDAYDRLRKGLWEPRQVLMHGNLAAPNILVEKKSDFVVVDWSSSKSRGYPFFDLLRFADTRRLSNRRLKHEVGVHAYVLESELEDARSHVLAALGSLLEEHPAETLLRLAGRIMAKLDALGLSAKRSN